MRSCCSIRQGGMVRPSWSYLPISLSCLCRPDARNSIRWRMCGSSCATTGCRTASTNHTTTSSITAASHGTSSSISHGELCHSAYADGRMGHDQCALVLGIQSCVSAVVKLLSSRPVSKHRLPFQSDKQAVPLPLTAEIIFFPLSSSLRWRMQREKAALHQGVWLKNTIAGPTCRPEWAWRER